MQRNAEFTEKVLSTSVNTASTKANCFFFAIGISKGPAIDVPDLFDISGVNGHLSWSVYGESPLERDVEMPYMTVKLLLLLLIRFELASTHVHLVRVNETSEWKAYYVL